MFRARAVRRRLALGRMNCRWLGLMICRWLALNLWTWNWLRGRTGWNPWMERCLVPDSQERSWLVPEPQERYLCMGRGLV